MGEPDPPSTPSIVAACGPHKVNGPGTFEGYAPDMLHIGTLWRGEAGWLVEVAADGGCGARGCLDLSVYLSEDEGCSWTEVTTGSGLVRAHEARPLPDIVYSSASGHSTHYRWDASARHYTTP